MKILDLRFCLIRPVKKILSFVMIHEALMALVLFSLISLVWFFPLIRNISTHILADDIFITPGRSDAYNFLWTFWWFQKALSLGMDLFQTDWVFPPHGVNLIFHTHILLPSIIAVPLSSIFGLVSAYNLTVISLIVLGAWSYFLFLRRTVRISLFGSYMGGIVFGFSPYFVFKAHAHVNLIGVAFWGSAIAMLIRAYTQKGFNWKNGFLFGLFFWATFWTSFLEFYMLCMVVSLVVIYFEVLAMMTRSDSIIWNLRSSLQFLLFPILGSISLFVLQYAPEFDVLNIPVFYSLDPYQFLGWGKLSILGEWFTSSLPEFWGNSLGLVALIFGIIGIVAILKLRSYRTALWFGLIALGLVMLLLLFNPAGIVSSFLGELPVARGFRVYSRFFSFFLFFFSALVAVGFEQLGLIQNRWLRVSAVLLVLVFFCIEYYPARLLPSPLPQIDGFHSSSIRLDPSKRVLVVPDGQYVQAKDIYQTKLDHPGVYVSYLAREPWGERAWREMEYPEVYREMSRGGAVRSEEWIRELRKLNVGYILFEDKKALSLFPSRVLKGFYPIFTNENQAIVELSFPEEGVVSGS